jgi:hypothetical protein
MCSNIISVLENIEVLSNVLIVVKVGRRDISLFFRIRIQPVEMVVIVYSAGYGFVL